MSMELYILCDRELTSVADWQAAIDAEGYPLQLASINVQLATHWGFLPAHLRGELTGFEFDHFPADEFLREMGQEMPDVDLGHDWNSFSAFDGLAVKRMNLRRPGWPAPPMLKRAAG